MVSFPAIPFGPILANPYWLVSIIRVRVSRVRYSAARIWLTQGHLFFDAPSLVRARATAGPILFGKPVADHYGSAEILFGQFRQSCASGVSKNSGQVVPICADKWCIFRNPSSPYTLTTVEEAIRERMQRTMSADGIDILQIHWQDYSQPQVYLDAFKKILQLRREKRLRIDVLGLVNFDTKRVIEICEALGEGEVGTNQIQVSYFDFVWRCRAFAWSNLAFSCFIFPSRPFNAWAPKPSNRMRRIWENVLNRSRTGGDRRVPPIWVRPLDWEGLARHSPSSPPVPVIRPHLSTF